MNYIERLLESQFASDELKDYLDRKEKRGNPKLSQKYKVAVNGDKNKDVNRRAKGLQNAPNAHRFAVQMNSKLRFNHINALAEPDGKYQNLVWILATGNRLNKVFKYINEFLGLEPNNKNIEIGDYQIRIADVSKQGVQQYFVRQNGIEFMKTIDKLMQDDEEAQQNVADQETPDGETIDLDQDDTNIQKREQKEENKTKSKQIEDPYAEDVVGYDIKKNKTIYKAGSRGWWAQRGEKAKELGIDPSAWNLDPMSWKISQSLKKAN